MPKFLTIGDPHIRGIYIIHLPIILKKIKKLHKKNNYDFIVILGDILHNHDNINIEEGYPAHQFIIDIHNICNKLYILIGNHDKVNESDFLTQKHMFNAFKLVDGITIVDDVIIDIINGDKCVFTPHVSDDRFFEALATKDLYPPFEDISLIFPHNEVEGCKINKVTKHKSFKWKSNYPLVISGHIHDYEIVYPNWYYVGSLFPTNDHDIQRKTISDFETNGREIINHNSYGLGVKNAFNIKLTDEELRNFIMPEDCTLRIQVSCPKLLYNKLLKLDNVKEMIEMGAVLKNIDTTEVKYVAIKEESKEVKRMNFGKKLEHNVLNTKNEEIINLYNELFKK